MARILVFLDDRSFYITEMAGSAAAVLQAIQAGELPEGTPFPAGAPRGRLSALQYGELIIAAVKSSADPPLPGLPAAGALPAGGLPHLTPRERQVLQLLAEGLTIKQIAGRLGLTPRTIRYYVHALNDKFGATSTEQSVGKGILLGLCQLPPETRPPGRR